MSNSNSLEKARKAQEILSKRPNLQYPYVNGIGISRRSSDGEYFVVVNVTGAEGSLHGNIPLEMDVDIVYRYNFGEVKSRDSYE